MPGPPPSLYVFSPNGYQLCAGEYRLAANESANNQPVWKQAGGRYWLYSAFTGNWIIGASLPKETDLARAKGMLFCKDNHNGLSPDRLNGVWLRLDESGTFAEDSDIKVTNHVSRPRELRLASPNGRESCVGEYRLLLNYAANGMPVWKLKNGSFWLYSGANGCWIIGGSEVRNEDFNCCRGVIYSKSAHGGVMPDKVDHVWLRLTRKEVFHEDSAIKVLRMPGTLHVNSPRGQPVVNGEYVPVEGKTVNGQPLWQHVSGKCWLYSGPNNVWIIGGSDAREKDFQCTRGVIYCKKMHGGNPPDQVQGGWLRLEGTMFCEDSSISVSTVPVSLHLVSPRGQKRCAGLYDLQPNGLLNGCPVWKQRRGSRTLCSDEAGAWCVRDEDQGADACGCITSQRPHRGCNPDKVPGSWAYTEGVVTTKDPGIQVVTRLDRPPTLFVTSPNAHQRCGGEYALVPGEEANEQPVWKQQDGKFWLYSGTNGMWIVGGNSAKDMAFNCSRGLIHSGLPHGGATPDQAPGPWQRLDGATWTPDSGISVTLRPPGEEAA